jgi:hypothetical protein
VSDQESDGATRLAYILGVPLAENVVRQWPQMGEVVRTSRLVADGRLYRNVTIGELRDGRAVRVTDYWGEPTSTPQWRPVADRPARYARRRHVARCRPPGPPLKEHAEGAEYPCKRARDGRGGIN